MREILFRGKRWDKGEWIEGWYVSALDEGHHCIFLASAPDMGEYVDPKTVGQYTGLTDKNGTKIFEGDILRFTELGHTANGVVVFANEYPGGWLVQGKHTESKCSLAMRRNVEVIGNIHDNPELLEE